MTAGRPALADELVDEFLGPDLREIVMVAGVDERRRLVEVALRVHAQDDHGTEVDQPLEAAARQGRLGQVPGAGHVGLHHVVEAGPVRDHGGAVEDVVGVGHGGGQAVGGVADIAGGQFDAPGHEQAVSLVGRTRARTRQPSSSRRRTRWLPTMPVAPVTNARGAGSAMASPREKQRPF